jgi:hypothetical protein
MSHEPHPTRINPFLFAERWQSIRKGNTSYIYGKSPLRLSVLLCGNETSSGGARSDRRNYPKRSCHAG